MKPPREIELKLEVPEQALTRLTRSLRLTQVGTPRPTSLVSLYYDTDTQKLRKHGLTLRVRRIGRRYVQTIKRESDASSALKDRCEWEYDLAGGRLNLALTEDTGLASILSKKLQAKLKPLFETRVRRRVYPIQSGGSEIELAIDKGMVAAGRQSSPICEAELELKRGNAAELFKVARVLAEQVPILNFYDRWVLPPILDLLMWQNQLDKYRREVVDAATARVLLEVGVGLVSGVTLSSRHLFGSGQSDGLS